VLRPQSCVSHRGLLSSVFGKSRPISKCDLHILPIRCRDTVTLPTVLCTLTLISMLHILDRVVPSQEGVYASGRSICSASPATCQLLRGYLERLHSKHGVLLVQYLNYPLIRLLLSLLESRRRSAASSLRIPADSNSDRMPHNHQRKTMSRPRRSGPPGVRSPQRRDGHALICANSGLQLQKHLACHQSSAPRIVSRCARTVAGETPAVSASAVSRTPTAYSSAATSRQTTAKPAGCMPPPNSLSLACFCNLPCQSLRLRRRATADAIPKTNSCERRGGTGSSSFRFSTRYMVWTLR